MIEIKGLGNGGAGFAPPRLPGRQRGSEAAAAGAVAGVLRVFSLPVLGVSVCGSVARWLAAGPLGRYRGPRWPQPARAAALTARTSALTRIWEDFNMRKF